MFFFCLVMSLVHVRLSYIWLDYGMLCWVRLGKVRLR
jgi:hypothetical protein